MIVYSLCDSVVRAESSRRLCFRAALHLIKAQTGTNASGLNFYAESPVATTTAQVDYREDIAPHGLQSALTQRWDRGGR